MPESYNYMVKRTLMTPVEERAFCPCGEELKSVELVVINAYKSASLHRCRNGHEQNMPSNVRYPRVVHVLAKNADKIKTSVYYN